MTRTAATRDRLEGLVRNGNTPQRLVPHARIALLSDSTPLNGAIAKVKRVVAGRALL